MYETAEEYEETLFYTNKFGCGNITMSFHNNPDAKHPFQNLEGIFF
jgi:hypothetical protein